ncbi:hypothetical protein N0V90_001205 [Kalmusia sp. IMI 367209]|nr:hypothetical protein N0V90_001205 [Kalmusia sp. IMI 367209]
MAPEIPQTCRAVVIDAPGAPWTLKSIPTPQAQQGEVLIKVLACGVCHSDSFLQQGAFGDGASFPRIPGHEIIGNIVALGPGETRWKVGQKVGGGWHGAHDGTCKGCNKGLYQMCESRLVNGVSRDGGYAEYCTLRSEAVIRLPDDADPAAYAPILCAGVAVFNGIRQMNPTSGSVVAVQGIGGLGHLAIQYARRMGFRTVALSTSSNKKEFAEQLGATDFVDTSKEDAATALQRMGGASLIVVTAPNASVMSGLVGGLGILGKLLILARECSSLMSCYMNDFRGAGADEVIAVGDVPINTGVLLGIGGSVHVWPAGHALDTEEAIEFAQRQGVKCLVEKFPLERTAEAVKRVTDNSVRFRGVIVME